MNNSSFDMEMPIQKLICRLNIKTKLLISFFVLWPLTGHCQLKLLYRKLYIIDSSFVIEIPKKWNTKNTIQDISIDGISMYDKSGWGISIENRKDGFSNLPLSEISNRWMNYLKKKYKNVIELHKENSFFAEQKSIHIIYKIKPSSKLKDFYYTLIIFNYKQNVVFINYTDKIHDINFVKELFYKISTGHSPR